MRKLIVRLAAPFGIQRAASPSHRVTHRGFRMRDQELEERGRSAVKPFHEHLSQNLVVGWNSRMRTTAGIAVLARDEIWLNPALREVPGDEVGRTLLHELAHLLARHRHPHRRIDPHGPEWREACRDLGIAGESRTHALPFYGRCLRRRFVLRCPACGRHHERVRKPKRPLACLHCCRAQNGGLYDDRFRFVLTPKEESGESSR
jgi:SprT protein